MGVTHDPGSEPLVQMPPTQTLAHAPAPQHRPRAPGMLASAQAALLSPSFLLQAVSPFSRPSVRVGPGGRSCHITVPLYHRQHTLAHPLPRARPPSVALPQW